MGLLRRSAVALWISAAVPALLSFVMFLDDSAGDRTSEAQTMASLWMSAPKRFGMAQQMPEVPMHTVSFETTEGTWMSVDVSPDGETIVFDLLGDIYKLPIEGGEAVALTNGTAWDQAPRFSPDGSQVYFVSDREGYKNLWRLSLTDRSLQQITRSNGDILGGPNWSQDGGRLLAGAVIGTWDDPEVILHAIHPTTGAMSPIAGRDSLLNEAAKNLRKGTAVYSGVESADGRVFYSEALRHGDLSHKAVLLSVFDAKSQTHTTITPTDAAYSDFKPQLSNHGKRVAYYRQYYDNDRHTELRILNRATGEDAALVELADADDAAYSLWDDARPNYAFTPDDRAIVFWHGGKIRSVNLADGQMNIIPFRASVEREVVARVQPTLQRLDDLGEAAVVRWPSLSRDGRVLAFTAVGYVYVMNMQTGDIRRLSDSDDFEYMPAISPDGLSVAYIGFEQSGEEYGFGRLMVADVAGGKTRELLAELNEDYILPEWSSDGSMIAVIREADRRRGIKAVFGWTPAAAGAFHQVATVTAFSNFANLFIYARSVGFDTAGEKLLFSYPRSRTETVLAAADLDGGNSRTLAVGTSEVGGITPAPDLKHLALTRRDGTIWLVPFEAGDEPVAVSSLATNARRVSANAGYYVDWNHSERLTFGFGKNIYRYRLDDVGLQSLCVEVPVATPGATQVIAFTGARLITMSGDVGAGSVIDSGTVIVDGSRIVALGPASAVAVPADALVIDATGKTIMPGLLDTHYHAGGMSALALPGVRFSEKTAIHFGITTAWSPGGRVDDAAAATVDLQRAGRIKGPRWSHAATGTVGYPFETLTGYAVALAAAEQHRDLGVDVLKEYNTPTREQRRWLSAAARENGVGIVSHLEDFDSMMTRIVDGYTGGDHPYVPVPLYKDVSEMLWQSGFIWTPNVTITAGSIGTPADGARYYCDAVLQTQERRSSGFRRARAICGIQGHRNPTVDYDSHRVSKVAEYVALAASHGVRIGVSAHNAPGSNLHREMWFLRRGGMPVEDVLRAATMVNAEKLGLQEEIGSLEVGKMADFLVLDDNPLDDILNTLSLKYTVQGGVVFDSATAERVDVPEIVRTQQAKYLH